MTADELMEWFWREWERLRRSHNQTNSICQCETERLIELSEDPQRMRALLLVLVAIDQALGSRSSRSADGASIDRWRYPEIEGHGHPGRVDADWVIYAHYGWDKKMNWSLGAEIAAALIPEVRKSLTLADLMRLNRSLEWLPQRFKAYDVDAALTLSEKLKDDR